MGMDKGSTKRGGFFHLFDWNKKSRKKLFSSGSVSPESPKQEKKSKECFSRTRRRLVDDDDEIFGVTSGRRSCDYSCASSMTDEDGITHRAPGVIARLMGLESMPTPIFPESSSTPFFDTRSLPDKQRDKINSEFYINDQFSDTVHKMMETKSLRMPSSPIERFQTEPIPPRSARSVPVTHHKLLSPIRNSGYISNKNASYIMEAAAKILDHRDQPSVRHNVSSIGSASVPLKVSSNSKNNTIIPQSHRRTRILESSSTSFEPTEFRNHNNGKSSNGADTTGMGKTVSLAIQAKVNVQKRVGLLSSRSSFSQKQEDNGSESNPLFNNQPNNYKNRQHQKSYANNTPSLLKQNRQKQNCISNQASLNSKQPISKQLNTNASVKKKNTNRISGNYRFSPVDREASSSSSSSCLSNNRRKRLTERSYVQSNIIIGEHRYSKRREDNRSNGSDVVSFTFTSPLNKHSAENRISEDAVEGMCTFNNHNQQNNEYANNEHVSSPGMTVITGDALSLLLDQKLRELTRVPEPEPSYCVSEEPESGFDSMDTAYVEHELLHNDKAGSNFGYGASSVNGQEVEECSSYSDARKDLEILYSSESSNFSESSDMTDGSGATCSSSIQAQNNFSSSINKNHSIETDSDLSDSACSTITDNSYVSDQFNSNSAKSSNYELNFLEEILHGAQPSIILGDKINPRLFEKLEENKTKKDKNEKLRRKMLFDCANECMEIKRNRYFSTGYQAWVNGVAITGNRTLGREIYDEISKWKSMEEWMIDEVVDQDMSSYFGKWLNYETEASDIGLQIDKEIMCSLIDEAIGDCLIKTACR